MGILTPDIINFFKKQSFVIVSTLDDKGTIHCSAKGMAGVDESGKLCLIDVYKGHTQKNLRRNPLISATAVEEHSFRGYTLKGRAEIIEQSKIASHFVKSWEERILQRMSSRVLKDIQKESKTIHHPESRLPQPEYLIEITVEEVVDLTPAHLKK